MVCPRSEWVYMIVEDLTVHCFSTSTENLEQAMQVSGCFVGDVCSGGSVHAHAHVHVYLHASICTGTNAGTHKEGKYLPLLSITI